MPIPDPASPGPKIVTLGCRLNLSESETLRTMLQSDADMVVVNSCAVTHEAVRHTRQTIRRMRRAHKGARLLVTGCAVETDREAIAAMPEVDGLIANASKLDPRVWNVPRQTEPRETAHTRAFIAIQNGCDHSCTFCIIPKGRGASRSLSISNVLREVERHLQRDAKEIVLTGVDVTSWGHDLPGEFALGELVKTILDTFPSLQRLRMSSLDGIEIDPLLFELFACESRVMPHLHLSLQHGHDLILKRMKRRHSRAQAAKLVRDLTERRPDIAIGADLIAGFPTETAEHHGANLAIIEELQIVHGHVFPYSVRTGTPAALMPQLDRAIIKQRAAQLRASVSRVRHDWLGRQLGRSLDVLAEQDGTGHAPNFARVAVPDGTPAGSIVNCVPNRIEQGLLL